MEMDKRDVEFQECTVLIVFIAKQPTIPEKNGEDEASCPSRMAWRERKG